MKKILLPFIISLTSLLFPIVNLSLGTIGENSVEIIIYTDMDIAGFQFDIDGVELSGGSGGMSHLSLDLKNITGHCDPSNCISMTK